MINWFRSWKAKRKHEKILQQCRLNGHTMKHAGEITPHKMVGGAPIPVGPAEFWIYACQNGCGHNEINVMQLAPYNRSYLEALKLRQENSIDKQPE